MNNQSDTNWLQEKNTIERVARIEANKVRTELRTELAGARDENRKLRDELRAALREIASNKHEDEMSRDSTSMNILMVWVMIVAPALIIISLHLSLYILIR